METSKLKVAFTEFDGDSRQVREALAPYASSVDFYPETLEERLGDLRECQVLSLFIHSRLDQQALEKLPQLQFVAARSTGYDNIDTHALERHGVTLSNIPFYGENTVAEHTFGLILSLSRNIHKAYLRTTRTQFSLEGLEGFDLKNKTLGVIGAGHIGLHVIKIAKGFGMNCLAYDVNKDRFIAEVLGFDYVDLEELLKRADIVSLHAPYLPATHHIINKKNIALMKPGALLINTARGALIDTQALVWALDKGIVGGAGLDVIEGEELITDEMQVLSEGSKQALATMIRTHILLNRENVVITPHIAFYSREAEARIMETTITNISSYAQGRPENVVAGPAERKVA